MLCSSQLLKMKTKTGAQIFDKALKEYVVKEKKRVLYISIRGQEVIMGGEEDSVVLAKENNLIPGRCTFSFWGHPFIASARTFGIGYS